LAVTATTNATAQSGGGQTLVNPGRSAYAFATPCLGAHLSGDGSISNIQAYWNLVLGLIAPLDGAPTDLQQIEFSVAVDGMEVVDEVFTGFGNQVVRERAYLLWEQVGRGIFWLQISEPIAN
jgi:hypothetical protein